MELQKIGVENFGGFDDELASELRLGLIEASEARDSGGGKAASKGGGSSQGGAAQEIGAAQDAGGTSEKDAKPKKERGLAWSEQEHKLFLVGLERFGKGDWRSISRQCVITRTPAQARAKAARAGRVAGSGGGLWPDGEGASASGEERGRAHRWGSLAGVASREEGGQGSAPSRTAARRAMGERLGADVRGAPSLSAGGEPRAEVLSAAGG